MTIPLFSPRARRELREAALWIARSNPAVAHEFVTEAQRAAERLTERPQFGRRRLPEPYRFWSLRGFPYVLVYNAAVRPPLILCVLHTSRDLPSVLAEFPL